MKREAITPCGERSASPAAVSGSGRSVGRRGAVAPGSAWALVTGAGSGIGRCYALRLAALLPANAPALLALVYAAGAMAAMYITYTPVGMVRIVGLQARYFLCVWLALLPALAVLLRKTICPAITEEKAEAAITPLCACYAVFGAVLLFQHYFVGPVYVVYA